MGLSKYFPEIYALAQQTQARAVYVFVLDGNRGSGGQPLLCPMPETHEEYLHRNREMIIALRRSADLLEQDIGDRGRTHTVPWIGARDEVKGWVMLLIEEVARLAAGGGAHWSSVSELAAALSERPIHIHGGDVPAECLPVTPEIVREVIALMETLGIVTVEDTPMQPGGEA
jgi:hypothetical protein